LLNTPAREVDKAITASLQHLVEACAGDYASLVAYTAAPITPQSQYCWGRPGVVSPVMVALPLYTLFPWYAHALRQGQLVCFSQPSELPAESAMVRQYCRRLGLQSFLALPLRVEGTVAYVLSVAAFRSARAWPHECIARLRLVGELLVSALMRQQDGATVQRLRQELAHTARIAMLGKLTASMVHELNQPLAAILSNAQAARRLLALAPPDLAEVRAALMDIIADNQRAGQVIQQLRSLGRKDTLDRAPVDVNALVLQVLQLMRNEVIKCQVTIRLDLATALPVAYGDRIQLQQVLLNLVCNAFEAMPQSTGRPRVLVVRTRVGTSTLTVEFQDSGVGVDATTLTHMFDAFFTTKAEGMGLGLAISQSIIVAHGGQIWARQNAGYGTTVGFTLPLPEGKTV
jgi:signal transduction histidine kinase